MIREIALESYSVAQQAVKAGVERIELNQRLDLGGLTPQRATWQKVQKLKVPVVVMVRPRGGDFNYNNDELKQMKATLRQLKADQMQSVTFGVLNADQTLNRSAMKELIELAAPMEVVMHMAFDAIQQAEQVASMQWLSQNHVHRILTHGGALTEDLSDTVSHLKALVKAAEQLEEPMIILPGGGVTADNIKQLHNQLGVTQFHGSRIIKLD